jgi:uncharacterized protein involved in outer membrane biogenesis
MQRRSIVKIAVLVIGVPLLLLAIVLLYLNFADLSGWRDTVAGFISESLGRELTINGVFEPEIGLTTHVTAGDIALANADWGSEPTMASIDHFEIEVRLLSVLSGPVDIQRLEVDGVRVLLESDGEGHANWEFQTGEEEEGAGPLELVLGQIDLSDVEAVYRDPSLHQPLAFGAAKLSVRGDDSGMLALQLDGGFGAQRVHVSGRLGTLDGLLNATALQFDLDGNLDGVHFATKGRIAELTTLGGADVTADLHGDDLSDLHGLLDLPPELTGAFSLSAALSPSASGSDVRLDAAAAGITAKVAGTVDSLLEPKILDATVTASGPSIGTVGSLTGVADLPADAFSVSGGVRWEGFPITFRQVEITVGDNSLAADGVLGAPPAMMGTDFSLQGQGPDISSIGALAGIDLPRDRFSIEGRVVRVDGGLDVKNLEARIGRAEVSSNGRVGDPPDYAGTDLSIHAAGPNIAHFNHLMGIELPAEPFTIDGRLAQGNEAITLEGVTARLGGTRLRVDGILKTAKGLSGTTLRIAARGPTAAQLRALTDLKDLPDEAWTITGGLAVLDSGLRLDAVSASVGSLIARADGRVATGRGAIGTTLKLHLEDPLLSHALSIFGLNGLPGQPVRVDGGLQIESSGYRLDSVTAAAGDIEMEITGLITAAPDLDGTQVHLKAHGPRLSSVGTYLKQDGLPPAPFSVSGGARVGGGAYTLDGVVAEIDGNRFTVDGIVRPAAGFVGTALEITVAAPDLGRAARLAAGFAELPVLPAEPFTLNTGLEIEERVYKIENLRATLASAVATIDGRVGSPPGLVGTDLTIDSDGPNASLFTALTGITIPVAPFRLRGRFQRTAAGYQFDRVSIQLGDYLADVHGSVGEPPRLVGTDVELRASGPRVALIGELAGLEHMPDEAFRFGGRFKGTPELFTTDGLEIAIGDSDLSGSLEVDIRGKPAAIVNLKSKHLDLSPFMKPLLGGGDGDQDEEVASSRGTGGTAISNEPIDFGPLQEADADVTVTIGTLQLPLTRFREVELGARLADGRLEVHRFSVMGQREGRGSGTLVLEPVGDDYRLHTVLDFDALRLDLPGEGSADPASEPSIDLDVRLDVVGKSPHGFASTADGSVQMVVGKGVMDNQILDLITADILLTLLTAFNPFAKEDAATELQCAVFLVSLEDGLATLEPMALQSDKMTMLGKGKIDLGTEKLDLEWITKPRKGIGISASMITNPYIKLGGTLSNPSVQMKGMEAVASTGVAVATMGISLVAKGFLDRITAEKKVCKKALEEIGRQSDPASKKSKKKRR